jgi:hypothetical protein
MIFKLVIARKKFYVPEGTIRKQVIAFLGPAGQVLVI